MKCILKIIEPNGSILNELEHDIPMAISTDKTKYIRNFLFIGDHSYSIRNNGEIKSITPEPIGISVDRMKEIKGLWQQKIQHIEKGLL